MRMNIYVYIYIYIYIIIYNDMLLAKLECIGLRGDTNVFITSYLENRNI